MKLESNDFKNQGFIPAKFTCDGEDVSPELHWADAPKETKSFALTVRDPDAVSVAGKTWEHWFVCNIPAGVNKIAEGSLPMNAEEVKNSFGFSHYGGPCPPSGVHRYYFTVYALNVERLAGASMQNFLSLLEKHSIAKAELMGKYKRK